jgi:hypothetical protein
MGNGAGETPKIANSTSSTKVAPLGVDHGDAGRSIKHVDAFRLSAALDWPTRLKLISDFTRFGASATLFARHFLGKPDDTPEL